MSGRSALEGDVDTGRPHSPARQIAFILDRIFESTVVITLLGCCLVAIMQVFFRYGLNNSLPWPEEVARLGFVWTVFVGMGLAIHRDAHLRIDLADRLFDRLGTHCSLAIRVVFIAAACSALAHHGTELVFRSISFTPALMISIKWLYLAVPAGAILGLVFLVLAPPLPLPGWSGVLLSTVGYAIYWAVVGPLVPFIAAVEPATVLVLVALVLVMIGVPIGFALVVSVFAALAGEPPLFLVTISQNMASATDNFTLMAIPFFITAAAVMNAGGITKRLIALAGHLVGHLRGGLAQVNILTSVMLAGVSGSSMADAGSIAKIMVPDMEERGYPRPFSCAVTASSAVIANLIPPGLGLIIYGALASASVGALFVATIVPGIMVAAVLGLVVHLMSIRYGYGGDAPRSSAGDRMRAFLLALPALTLPVIIVGGVRFGMFTATEAGAMAFLYAIFCGLFLYRVLSLNGFVQALREAAQDTIVVMFVVAAASPFAWILASQQVPQNVGLALAGVATSPDILLALIILLLLFIGLFMEMIAAMVIMVPVFVPIIIQAGIDPIHFGIIVVLSLVIGALTPPLGILVFTTARIARASPIHVFKALIPFLAAMIAVLFLVAFVPIIATGLVQVLGP